MQNGGTDFTNKWAAESFGKVFEMITTSGPGGPHTGPRERYLVHPEEFIRLQRPNPQALFAAAFIYSDGRAWKATGKTYLPHVFKLN